MTLNKTNIILIGFMASGKSRIGERLAKILGFNLIDVDAVIERNEGQSIKDMVEHKGEWYFRQAESKAIKNLDGCHNTVIVTGGGAPMFFDNAAKLKQLGEIFFLDANLSLIINRLKNNTRRPLGKLGTERDLEKIKELYGYRRPIYLNLAHVIDVNHEDKDKTCHEIIEIGNATKHLENITKTIVKEVVGNYPIYHQPGVLKYIEDIIVARGLKNNTPVIITTVNLYKILSSSIEEIRQKIGINVPIITIKDGEQHKTLSSVNYIHDEMFKRGLTRKTLVIAIGGGNVGDVAGFAASIYLRGVPFIQIPTTLLAMVDASIGGKTGVDVSFGKNLVGSFYNPRAVIIDPTLLTTLPEDDFSCGMAEIIKHAIIADRDLFYLLKDHQPDLTMVIERALKVKAHIVFNDPQESNIRAHLNLGHTFGHAIEKVSNYQIKHGHAVAMGLILAGQLARKLGILEEDFLLDLEQLLKKSHLPTTMPKNFKKNDLLEAMKYDKKRDPAGLKLVLPKKLGEVVVRYVDEGDIF